MAALPKSPDDGKKGGTIVRRMIVGTDLTEGSFNALCRARYIAGSSSELRVVHALPSDAADAEAASARDRVEAVLRKTTGLCPGSESGLSIRICRGDPSDVILRQAEQFDADLIILGAHGAPRLREAIFGTTASHVMRDATRPVLVAQNDGGRPYSRLLVAVDSEAADQVLDLSVNFTAPTEVFLVHAFRSPAGNLIGATDLLEDVRTDQDVLIARARQRLAAAGRKSAHFHAIVEGGDEMDVIMRAWTRVNPDLVVMGTHGRKGFAHLLHGSLAETALLGCPTDMLIMRTGHQGERRLSGQEMGQA